MRALDRKLARDLWSQKTQVLSIALVIACGIGGFIASLSTHDSLLWSRDHYYDSARFPHVFASLKRAPDALLPRIRSIPGVSEAQVRIVRDAQLDVAGVSQPMTARMIGMRFERPQTMNRVTLTGGRWPVAGARNEVVVNQRFFEARRLALGQPVRLLLNGKRERFDIVGTGLSPEFIFATRGGALPDDEWFAIFWMDAGTLASAYDMDGAFNSVLVRLSGDASAQEAIRELDGMLEPYGTAGGVGRTEQISHKIITQEIEQQRVMGTVLPSVFLLVATFILNVVLHRMVNTQRGEIAALKALGYGNRSIAVHYLKFTSMVVALGVLIGAGLGYWLGQALTGLYTHYFHFPGFHFGVTPATMAGAAAAALIAGYGGALFAIRGVVRLKAAEALRPPAPATYRPLFVERIGYAHLLTPAQRMILRNLERKPLRAALTVAGISGSIAILLAGTCWNDAIERFIEVQFGRAQAADVILGFAEPVSPGIRFELQRLPGVLEVETSRSIAARLRAGHREYRAALTGLSGSAHLQRIVDMDMRERETSPGGLVLTTRLADRLGVSRGDAIEIEFLEGRRARRIVRVAATARELAGMNAYMELDELNRLAGDSPQVGSAQLRVDRPQQDSLLARLKEAPAVATVIVKSSLLDTFRSTSARNMLFFTGVLTAFAAVIAIGVVYNNARIQLAERAWELASLRVIGMTRAEVSVLLLGELAIEILVAIPFGFVAGYWLSTLIAALTHGEAFEIPMVILPPTYLYAAATVLAAGLASAMIVRNRIDRLDLVAVLKTRE